MPTVLCCGCAVPRYDNTGLLEDNAPSFTTEEFDLAKLSLPRGVTPLRSMVRDLPRSRAGYACVWNAYEPPKKRAGGRATTQPRWTPPEVNDLLNVLRNEAQIQLA